MDKQLTLFPNEGTVSDTNSLSLTNVIDAKNPTNQYFHKNTKPHIGTYSPARRKANYYRFSYRDGEKIKHIHIPGGNSSAPLVQYRVQKIQGMIDQGLPLTKILTLISSYKGNSKI